MKSIHRPLPRIHVRWSWQVPGTGAGGRPCLLRGATAALVLMLPACGRSESINAPDGCRLGAAVAPPADGWRKVPAVTVAAAPDDPRLPAVYEAIDYWNEILAGLGTPFRLGPATAAAALADACMAAISTHVLSQAGLRELPAEIRHQPGDLILALTDADLISFAYGAPAGGKVLVAIRSHRLYPLTLPNVSRNLIAHELGHALGLGHNDDPAMLMCGRPAPCRPDAFQSATPRFFPLTEAERAQLRALYPVTWAPQQAGFVSIDGGSRIKLDGLSDSGAFIMGPAPEVAPPGPTIFGGRGTFGAGILSPGVS